MQNIGIKNLQNTVELSKTNRVPKICLSFSIIKFQKMNVIQFIANTIGFDK